MKGYEQYVRDVLSGKILTCCYVKQLVERFEEFRNRDDIYFDSECVDTFISFVGQMKHWVGDSAGKYFTLLPWQQFFFACILGLKWKKTGLRICRETYLQLARKQGKSSIIAALALWHMIGDGEAAPFVACLASTRDQARLIFEMCQNYAKSIDPKGQFIKYYRNYMKMPVNNGEVKIFSSDASKLDGLNVSLGIVDEYAVQPDNQLYGKIKTSMGFRSQPLMVLITTPQGNLNSPAFKVFQTSIEILSGVKTDDTFWPFIYTLDPDEMEQWDNEDLWIKSNPGLGDTIRLDYLKSECLAAKNDTSKQVDFKTLHVGIWCQSNTVWIDQTTVAACMTQKIEVENFAGWPCVIGMDLGSVSDFTSITAMWFKENMYYFKSWCFLPENTLQNHQNRILYHRFIQEGTMIPTAGNCLDANFVAAKIGEIAQVCPIDKIYTDTWNARDIMITLGDMGLEVVPFSQSIGHFNSPTKELERLIRDGQCVIDRSQCVLWQFGNVELRVDYNGNCKPDKSNYQKKIDSTISMCTALGGFEEQGGAMTDFEIFCLD
jgi:phage terminase large subunit-like protein